jgi:hypothetical protein
MEARRSRSRRSGDILTRLVTSCPTIIKRLLELSTIFAASLSFMMFAVATAETFPNPLSCMSRNGFKTFAALFHQKLKALFPNQVL